MPQANILLSRRLLPKAAYSITPSAYLAEFEQAISFFGQVWHNYQPDDLLAVERKQDLEGLKSLLQDYRLNIQNSSKSREFWQGFMEGKDSRIVLSDRPIKPSSKVLIKTTTSTTTQQIYELGVQVGWCYARLKDYLQRIKKQRKLEEAQRHQDYQQISSLIRPKDETEDMDSLFSFNWARKRGCQK